MDEVRRRLLEDGTPPHITQQVRRPSEAPATAVPAPTTEVAPIERRSWTIARVVLWLAAVLMSSTGASLLAVWLWQRAEPAPAAPEVAPAVVVAPAPAPVPAPRPAIAEQRPERNTKKRTRTAAEPRAAVAPSETAASLYELGRLYFKERKLLLAIEAFNRCLAADAAHASAYRELGRTYAVLGNEPEALKAFREYVRLAPDRADAQKLQKLLPGAK
jgi:tetratricopeptide (TPR) repeat protein